MERADALARLAAAPRGHLATVRPDGRPHVVVITFAMAGESVVTAIDQKPKTTTRLQRLINIEQRPEVALLVDHYEDHWDRLWWVRVDGTAGVVSDERLRREAIEALQEKYRQYRAQPPRGPVVAISIDAMASWAGQ